MFSRSTPFYVVFIMTHLLGAALCRRSPEMFQVDDNLMMMRCHMRYCRSPQDDVRSTNHLVPFSIAHIIYVLFAVQFHPVS